MIKKLSRLTSFTETEIKIFIFVLTMFSIGLGLKYYSSTKEQLVKKFSYAKEDSLFAYFNNLELDTSLAENESFLTNKKSFVAKNKEQIPYVKKSFSGKLNLNTASLEQLATLPGIGEKTAGNIYVYRNRVGKIKSLDELLNIKGIGEKKISKLKDFLTLK
ncbi:MAG: helix-hairpin-helix domain-containing protein [Ignavibacteria bacterium]|nr:helix-hairpin-helix domain-containing protein [Ignavibacteria bacterium]